MDDKEIVIGYSFKNTESEEARRVLTTMAKNLVSKKSYSLKKLSEIMTQEKASRIKVLRRNCTYGALARKISEEWDKKDVFWIDFPSSQVVGSALCEVAMDVLGEDLEQFEEYE